VADKPKPTQNIKVRMICVGLLKRAPYPPKGPEPSALGWDMLANKGKRRARSPDRQDVVAGMDDAVDQRR
jgi:hypothetical protein